MCLIMFDMCSPCLKCNKIMLLYVDRNNILVNISSCIQYKANKKYNSDSKQKHWSSLCLWISGKYKHALFRSHEIHVLQCTYVVRWAPWYSCQSKVLSAKHFCATRDIRWHINLENMLLLLKMNKNNERWHSEQGRNACS